MLIDMWNRLQNALVGRGLRSDPPDDLARTHQRVGRKAIIGHLKKVAFVEEDCNDDFVDLTYDDGRFIRLRRYREENEGLVFFYALNNDRVSPDDRPKSIIVFDPRNHDRIKQSVKIPHNSPLPNKTLWADDPRLDGVLSPRSSIG